MPNLLEYIGQGLRTAGGISSPQVFQANVQREAQLNQLKAARDQALYSSALDAYQNGAITKDVFDKVAANYGYAGAVSGPNVEAQKFQRENALIRERGLAKQKVSAGMSPVGQPSATTPSATVTSPQDTGASTYGIQENQYPGNPQQPTDQVTTAPTTEVVATYNQEQNPDFWLKYAQERGNAGDHEEESRALKIASDLYKELKDKVQIINDKPYLVRPIIKKDGGMSLALEKVPGDFSPDAKGQIVDLGDRVVVMDPKKIGDSLEKGLSPKNAAKGVGSLDQKDIANIEAKLRDDFTGQSKNFIVQRDSYDRILASAQDSSAAGDLSLIFAYMKLLDPISVVREGEFATAQNAGSVPQSIIGQYNRVVSGERLAPDLREDFVKRAGILYERAKTAQNRMEDKFKGIAKRSGVDPQNVVIEYPLSSNFSKADLRKKYQLEPTQ